MKIGYAEILKIYKRHDSISICHALKKEFNTHGFRIDANVVCKRIGMDVYGWFSGWLKFNFFNTREFPPMLECMYPSLSTKLGIHWAGPMVFDIIVNRNFTRTHKRKEYRIQVLTVLSQRFPNTKFNVKD